jgi:O-6-methylguanine DNA methyltransferase
VLRLKFDPVEDSRIAEQVGDQIRRFLAGERDALAYRADLSLVAGNFQRRALERLAEVPFGAVVTYHALAATIGAPNGQRAVGNAMAANPIPIYVPCHRVVRSDGVIGHYGGGTQCKVELLRTEGFAIDKSLRIPAQAVCGHRGTQIFCKLDCAAARRADPTKMLIFASPESARHAGMRACRLCHPL